MRKAAKIFMITGYALGIIALILMVTGILSQRLEYIAVITWLFLAGGLLIKKGLEIWMAEN